MYVSDKSSLASFSCLEKWDTMEHQQITAGLEKTVILLRGLTHLSPVAQPCSVLTSDGTPSTNSLRLCEEESLEDPTEKLVLDLLPYLQVRLFIQR